MNSGAAGIESQGCWLVVCLMQCASLLHGMNNLYLGLFGPKCTFDSMIPGRRDIRALQLIKILQFVYQIHVVEVFWRNLVVLNFHLNSTVMRSTTLKAKSREVCMKILASPKPVVRLLNELDTLDLHLKP